MASSSPEICVIVVAFRGDRWIERCVESLYASTTMPIELLVIDNGDTPSLSRLRQRFPAMKVCAAPRQMGFADANNVALPLSGRTPFVCLLNQDTISGENWLESCVSLMREDANLAAVVPVTWTYDGSGLDPAFKDCLRGVERQDDASGGHAMSPRTCRVPFAPAAAMVVRREALDRAGGFDPLFGSYYEDYDLCRRLREDGYSIAIATDASIRHYSGSATNDDAARDRRGRLLVRNRAIHEIRCSSASRIAAVARYFLVTFPRRLARSIRGRSVHSARQLLAGNFDLLKLIPRLISKRRDDELLHRDLAEFASAQPADESDVVLDQPVTV